ncbi:MAG TPA: helix-turn-helix domain-containing protein [Acidimicrobiales bacterium]|nr:helix-turn-helix domain-containing protein [Acidimicrobiales bacterium]
MVHSLEEILPGRSVDDALDVAERLVAQDELVVLVDGEKVALGPTVARLLTSTIRSVAGGGSTIVVRQSEHLSPREAAQLLGVSRPTIVSLIRQGVLTDHPVGSHHRVDASELEGLIEERRQQARAARVRVASLSAAGAPDQPEPTPRDLFAAALAARAGDRSRLEALGSAELADRARLAAERAAGTGD